MAKQRKSIAADAAGDGASNTGGGAGAGALATARLKPKWTRARMSVPRDCAALAPSERTSIYHGVTRHRWTGRFEAHLWDKDTWSESQRKKKGRQDSSTRAVYLGTYSDEEAAARTYDLVALKY